MLGSQDSGLNTGFWLDAEDEDDESANPGAIRVLVCGNTGGMSSRVTIGYRTIA